MTNRRLEIIHKIRANQTYADIAKKYWVRKIGSKIVEWVDSDPGDHSWEPRRMIGGGIAFRGGKHQRDNGIDVYKGENIIAGELQGEPALRNTEMSMVDDQGLWKYDSIHPAFGLAIAQVAQCPNGVMFDPSKVAFTNTATILFPADEMADMPFDLLLLSRVYVWYYALVLRMGVLDTFRSHVYPTNAALLPWCSALGDKKELIEAMRNGLIESCTNRISASESLIKQLAGLSLKTFKERLRADADASLVWGDSFLDPKYETLIATPHVEAGDEGRWRVCLSADLFDWVECNREEIATGLCLALLQNVGDSFGKSTLLNTPVPVAPAEVAEWNNILLSYDEAALVNAMEEAIQKLDLVVGEALGLDSADLIEIRRDMQDDSFLSQIHPRYPGTVTRKQGFRRGLDTEARYA